ncbi:hypothetical protein CEQ90_12295 [Lewinellaceae bacterium SD302]|nr:hypothetical protein CEQ90_12295 [Lewinellaceae bacterium SD302]
MSRHLLLLATLCGFSVALSAQYRISGHLNIGEEWQPKVYLAAIDKLSDYYRTSPDMIVNTAQVNEDGTFVLSGGNLPDEPRFYRLYLMKQQNTDYDACLYVGGDDHNFAHLILQNNDELSITTDSNTIAPFGNYTVSGSSDNQLMRELASIVYPSFYFYRIKFPTELKFSEDRLHADLIRFADTCQNPLVALAAVNNTDFDEYFDRDRDFYLGFGERLNQELPHSIYTGNYRLKCRYYANEEVTAGLPWWAGLSMLILALLAASGWWQFIRLKALQQLPPAHTHSQVTKADPFAELTPKESEILTLIAAGKSNKEIASELFVEVSTVKTHINKLYGKIGVGNRKEARAMVEQSLVRSLES